MAQHQAVSKFKKLFDNDNCEDTGMDHYNMVVFATPYDRAPDYAEQAEEIIREYELPLSVTVLNPISGGAFCVQVRKKEEVVGLHPVIEKCIAPFIIKPA